MACSVTTSTMTIDPLILQIATGALIGLGAGVLGSLMLLRRMALVGDALSHVALPGIALALLIGIHPFFGAFGALAFAVLGIWSLQQRTALPSEALVGIFFTTALAAGLLLTPEPDLLEALFGNISTVTLRAFLPSAAAIAVMLVVLWRIRSPLVLGILNTDMTRVLGIGLRRAELLFFGMVAVVVALGISVTGAVLTGSLVIIPAAAARNITRSLNRYMLAAGAIGAVAGGSGVLIAAHWALPAGPIVILAGAVIFLATLPFRRA